MIKVSYNKITTLVEGYYPSNINYTNVPEPWIEIQDNEQIIDKQMCVIDGKYQIYIEPLSVQLQKAKNEKIAQLNQYYASDECWTFRLKSTTLKASLTKTADFFAKVLPAIDSSFAVYFETDDKKIISTNLSTEKAKKINAKIQLEISIHIKKSRIETEVKILNCKTIEEIALIDIKKALGVVPREIEIDNI